MPLEETVSRRAIGRAYAQASGEHSGVDVREIAQRARQGDRAAVDLFTHAFRALGAVLSPLLVVFEATVLVVGGSISAAWDLVAPPLRSGLADTAPDPSARIALGPARHLVDAPLLGAAYLVTASRRPARVASG